MKQIKIKKMVMKDCIKIFILFITFLFTISCSYKQDNLVNLTLTRLNLIKEKKYIELNNSLYNFKYSDTIFLNKINKYLKNDSLIFKIDTTVESYIVNVSISSNNKYDEFTLSDLLSFNYNKKLTNYCILYVSNILPSKVEYREEEINDILKQYKEK